jgi:hypothetical protein
MFKARVYQFTHGRSKVNVGAEDLNLRFDRPREAF